MLLTDLNGPMSVKPRRTGSGKISRASRFAAPAILFLSSATLGAAISHAQDDRSVAEAARQERARKQELQKRSKHVYTDEDLKHSSILTPEDRAQIEAKRNECVQKNNCSPAPLQNPPASLDANSPAPGTSVGEVALQLRKQKELQALKPKQTEPFHLPVSTPSLASPILLERPAIHSPAQPVLRPKTASPMMPSNIFRRDPFAAVPIRPEVRSGVQRKTSVDVNSNDRENPLSITRPSAHRDLSNVLRPTFRAPRELNTPTQPRISSRPAPASILIQPMQPFAPSKPAESVAPVPSTRPTQPSAKTSGLNVVSVKRGDSLWKLSLQTLGRGSRWPEILAINPRIADPKHIRIGARLNLPTLAASERGAKTNAATTIKVRRGDTLWSLAKSNLGRSSYWPCLAAANPSLTDPNRVYEAQQLVVPAGCNVAAAYSPSRARQ